MDPRVHDTLVKNADGAYTFTPTPNLAFRFARDGKLTSITDRNGNSITLSDDGTGLDGSG